MPCSLFSRYTWRNMPNESIWRGMHDRVELIQLVRYKCDDEKFSIFDTVLCRPYIRYTVMFICTLQYYHCRRTQIPIFMTLPWQEWITVDLRLDLDSSPDCIETQMSGMSIQYLWSHMVIQIFLVFVVFIGMRYMLLQYSIILPFISKTFWTKESPKAQGH